MDENVREHERKRLGGLPPGIWALGFVSMFMDISSEMIHGLLPVFLTSMLGASTEMVGLIEGVGEATASICKLFSGWLSDTLGKRKVLAVFGYGLAALSKPLFAVAGATELAVDFARGYASEAQKSAHTVARLVDSSGQFLLGGEVSVGIDTTLAPFESSVLGGGGGNVRLGRATVVSAARAADADAPRLGV